MVGVGIGELRNIRKPQKVYNNGIYLVYTRHMTTYSIYLEYIWYIPVIMRTTSFERYITYQVYTPGSRIA